MSTAIDSIVAGSVNTQEQRPWNKPQNSNTVKRKLIGTYSSPPRVAVGLNFLVAGQTTDPHCRVDASDVTTTDFTVTMDGWADSVLYIAGMSYLELGSKLKHIRTGVFRVVDVRPWNVPTPLVQKRINFDTPFTDGPPKVICWLRSVDTAHKFNCRLSATVQNIDQNGFTATLSTWADTIMYSSEMTWIAYSSKQPGVASGEYGVCDNRSRWATDQKQVTGKASFGNAFKTTPNLIVGLNMLDFGNAADIRIAARTSAVTASGFNWSQDSWADTLMYEARTSWFAWTDEIETPPGASISQDIPSWVIEYRGHYLTTEPSGARNGTGAGYAGGDSNTTKVIHDSGSTTKSTNDNTDTVARYTNNNGNTTRYFGDRYGGDRQNLDRQSIDRQNIDRQSSDRYSSDRYTNDRYISDRYSSERNGSDRNSARYSDLDRGSTRYSELTKTSMSSPPRSDRTMTTTDRVISSGRIDNLDASTGRIGSLDASLGRIGNLDATSGRIGSTERITSMERIGSSDEIDTSEIIEDSGTTGYTTTERIVSTTYSSS